MVPLSSLFKQIARAQRAEGSASERAIEPANETERERGRAMGGERERERAL